MGATSFGLPTKPSNAQDCVLCLMVICCGLVITALLIGSVTSAISQMTAEKKQKTQRMEVLLAHLRSRMINPKTMLYKKVRGYCEFVYENGIDTGDQTLSSEYFGQLPESLRVELIM
jgi:hypothetical protein